ncbi:MAG: glycoside hydrolase family 127 protein [Eubacteriales bacterium]|nr:glycoside hydrolase family 127 protein [Eubacteriales bacterium]
MANDRLRDYVLFPAPLGSVEPTGWLLREFLLQKEGLTGHIDALWEDLGASSGWLGGPGENWERGPYYLDGLIPLAWSLGDTELQQKAQKWIEWILQSQREDGFFGPPDNLDWWPRIVALKALVSYHEVTGDERVLVLMDRYFRYQLNHLSDQPLAMWAAVRGLEQLLPMLYLYRKTNADYLIELANSLRTQSYRWDSIFSDFPYRRRTHAYLNRPLFLFVKRLSLVSDWAKRKSRFLRRVKPQSKQSIEKSNTSRFLRVFHETHSVNLAMALKMPALDALWSGDPAKTEASPEGIAALNRYHGLANGLFSGDEHLNGRSPTVGAELCLAAEYMFSLETLLAITGQAKYADLLEQIAFNAWPAMFTPDLCAHQYVQQVNQIEVSRQKRNWYDAYREANLFGLKPNFGCCAANMHQGWPKLLGSLFLTSCGGVTAAVYAPCSATLTVLDTRIHIIEETAYPFDETVSFTFEKIENAAGCLRFSLKLRIPEWSKSFEIHYNNQSLDLSVEDGYAKFEQVFHAGDRVRLTLAMPLRLHYEESGGVTVHRGPLLFALPILEEHRVVRGTPPFADFELFPRSPWRYAIAVSEFDHATIVSRDPGEFPFGEVDPAVLVSVKAVPVPHWAAVNHSAGPIPPPFFTDSGRLIEKTLVPYGCARLRIAQFPIAYSKEKPI